MFSSLSQNSILYVLDIKGDSKILSGPIDRVSIPRPKYSSFNPNMEMIVDIIATIDGEKREFKGVPNSSIANFENNSFIIAESKEAMCSYINSMLQNSKRIIESVDKHKQLISTYEAALQELDPNIKANVEKDKAIQSLQEQMAELKQMLTTMTQRENN